jgi:hypothetical protein
MGPRHADVPTEARDERIYLEAVKPSTSNTDDLLGLSD